MVTEKRYFVLQLQQDRLLREHVSVVELEVLQALYLLQVSGKAKCGTVPLDNNLLWDCVVPDWLIW
ncbi:hypothetical protein ES708_30292 [subsurface metagenome]